MRKITIVINGKGGVGKDTICDIVSKNFPTMSVSAITPIKEIALKYGWSGEKDLKSRRFLSELKRVFTEYNDLSTNYLLSKHKEFLSDENLEIIFVHIREADQIEAFLEKIDNFKTTLLIKKRDLPIYNNVSDDNAENFSYSYTYMNDKSIEKLEEDFMDFFQNILDSYEKQNI